MLVPQLMCEYLRHRVQVRLDESQSEAIGVCRPSRLHSPPSVKASSAHLPSQPALAFWIAHLSAGVLTPFTPNARAILSHQSADYPCLQFQKVRVHALLLPYTQAILSRQSAGGGEDTSGWDQAFTTIELEKDALAGDPEEPCT